MSDKSLPDESIARVFDVLKRIGSGAYGFVWECIDRNSKRRVAVKKIQEAFRNPTDSQRTYREIIYLRYCRCHPNIVSLLDVRKALNNMDIYLVFEFMETDLHNLISKKKILTDNQLQLIIFQILRAVKFMHSGGIVHRDLKPANILVNPRFEIKIGDFGLARSMEYPKADEVMTGYVATRWYRAPEILFDAKWYNKGVDLWSVGCILGEMIIGQPLFQGKHTEHQIEIVMEAIPKPSQNDIDGVRKLGGCINTCSKWKSKGCLNRKLKQAGGSLLAIDLVQKFLVFSPEKRLPAYIALRHPYISRFYKENDGPVLKKQIATSISDRKQLSVDEYRCHIYKGIEAIKIAQRTVQIRSSYRGLRPTKSATTQIKRTMLPTVHPSRTELRSRIPLEAPAQVKDINRNIKLEQLKGGLKVRTSSLSSNLVKEQRAWIRTWADGSKHTVMSHQILLGNHDKHTLPRFAQETRTTLHQIKRKDKPDWVRTNNRSSQDLIKTNDRGSQDSGYMTETVL